MLLSHVVGKVFPELFQQLLIEAKRLGTEYKDRHPVVAPQVAVCVLSHDCLGVVICSGDGGVRKMAVSNTVAAKG